MEIIYGTGNQAKIAYMKRALEGLPLHITGLAQAAAAKGVSLPQVEETGMTPLENARLKAECYLWNHETGKALPREEQPGVCVRGRGEVRLGDEELLSHYIGLVRKYGQIRARYKNGVCLIWSEEIREESMEEALWGEDFLLTDIPHSRRVEGFPLDSISIDKKCKKYFYDMEENQQDDLVSQCGFRRFFRSFLKKYDLL